MGKLTTYLLIISGLVILFYFTGLTQECTGDSFCQGSTPSSLLLNMLLNPGSIPNIDLNIGLILATVLSFGAGTVVTVAFLASGKPELAVMAAAAGFLASFLFDIVEVYSVLAASSKEIAILLMAPVMLLLVITIIEWWRGTD